MLSLLFLQFNKQNLRTRLLAGILVLAIFLLLAGAVAFRLFLFDHLAGYASKNTVFYLHLNLDNKGNFYQAKVINSILREFRLADFDQHYLHNELAVICNDQPINNCFLIFFSDNKKDTEKYLKTKKIAYRTAGFNVFLIPRRQGESPTPKKSWNPLIHWRYQSGLLKDDLTLVLKPSSRPQTLNQKILSFIIPYFRLSGRLKNQGLILKPFSFADAKSDWQSDYIDINRPPFDLIVNLASPTALSPLLINYLNQISANNWGKTLDVIANGNLVWIMNKENNTNQLFSDYNIYLNLTAKIDSQSLTQLRLTMQEIASRLVPTSKNIYLNDGTRVTLFNPNPGLTGSQSTDSFQLPLTDKRAFFFKTEKSGLIIGNNPEFQPDISLNQNSYGLIRLSSLPNYNPLRKYLSEFSVLYFDDKKIIVK